MKTLIRKNTQSIILFLLRGYYGNNGLFFKNFNFAQIFIL